MTTSSRPTASGHECSVNCQMFRDSWVKAALKRDEDETLSDTRMCAAQYEEW